MENFFSPSFYGRKKLISKMTKKPQKKKIKKEQFSEISRKYYEIDNKDIFFLCSAFPYRALHKMTALFRQANTI